MYAVGGVCVWGGEEGTGSIDAVTSGTRGAKEPIHSYASRSSVHSDSRARWLRGQTTLPESQQR